MSPPPLPSQGVGAYFKHEQHGTGGLNLDAAVSVDDAAVLVVVVTNSPDSQRMPLPSMPPQYHALLPPSRQQAAGTASSLLLCCRRYHALFEFSAVSIDRWMLDTQLSCNSDDNACIVTVRLGVTSSKQYWRSFVPAEGLTEHLSSRPGARHGRSKTCESSTHSPPLSTLAPMSTRVTTPRTA